MRVIQGQWIEKSWVHVVSTLRPKGRFEDEK